jgi:hypothetical protein
MYLRIILICLALSVSLHYGLYRVVKSLLFPENPIEIEFIEKEKCLTKEIIDRNGNVHCQTENDIQQ